MIAMHKQYESYYMDFTWNAMTKIDHHTKGFDNTIHNHGRYKINIFKTHYEILRSNLVT